MAPATRFPGAALFAFALTTLAAPAAHARDAASETLVFERDIRPILKAHCFHCHGEGEEASGGLDLRLVRGMRAGGHSGPAIDAPADREEHLLYQRVRDGEMPPDESAHISADEIERLGRWLEAGAPTARPEPESADDVLITPEEREHWAYQPIVRPDVPSDDVSGADVARAENPVDRFVFARLAEQGLEPAERASAWVELRRVHFDLSGLPPAPGVAARYVDDPRPGRYRRLVDRLLSDPRYGERWGRHWLDVAGYADSEGYTDADPERPHAYRYRDWVIAAFNRDYPLDEFVLDQLAGDQRVTNPPGKWSQEDVQRIVATGFLRTAPDGTASRQENPVVARDDVAAEQLKIVAAAFFGVTVGCAQCHDHRYDPIPQEDYFRLRSVFAPAWDLNAWQSPAARRVSLYSDEDRAAAEEIEAEAKAIEARRGERQEALIEAVRTRELEKLPEETRALARDALETPAKERTDEQRTLLKQHPSLNVSAGSLYLYDKKAADELKQMADEAAAVRARKPTEHFVRALTEPAGKDTVAHLHDRGDPEQPRDPQPPGGLRVVSLNCDPPEIPHDDPGLATTGRRLALARRLTDPRHPLLARVLVNRVWLHHFGRGLVATPDDFGALGQPPSHPELLDWLAAELIASGWSVKHLQRLIVTSATYRQAVRSAEQAAADPDGRLLAGRRPRRVEAETLRDALLACSGQLWGKMGGPPVPVKADRVGRIVIGQENLNAGRPGEEIPLHGEDLRRSVYIQVRRSRPLSTLETFDAPRMEPNCAVRSISTSPSQALALLNGPWMQQQAAQLAARVRRAEPESLERQIDALWLILLARGPTAAERSESLEHLRRQRALLESRLAEGTGDDALWQDADHAALASLGQMLAASNAFLYID